MQHEKVIIIGSGPAGYTAALYTARANFNPLVVTGDQPGGQVSITHEVENYPGFPQGVMGPDLVELFRQQAEKFGARVEFDYVSEVDFTQGSPFTVRTTQGKEYRAEAVIVATGASPRKLGIPGEDEFIGRGVSYCGTCDGFFFRDKKVVVVGGGDTAVQEAIFLTKFATSVTIIHRRDEFRAGQILQDRAFRNEKINVIWDSVVDEIVGNGKVDHVRVRNLKTGQAEDLKTDGVFVFIGHYPNSSILQGQIELDEAGYVVTDELMRTSVDGVFAAGEIQDPIFRQIGTSVGQGTAAGIMATRWLEEHEDEAALSAQAGD